MTITSDFQLSAFQPLQLQPSAKPHSCKPSAKPRRSLWSALLTSGVLALAATVTQAVPLATKYLPWQGASLSDYVRHHVCQGEFAQMNSVTNPSRGCVVNTLQVTSDDKIIQAYGTEELDRRYIVYVPKQLRNHQVPVVFGFHGFNVNAETFAWQDTHQRLEQLAERDGFVVVYPQGLPATAGTPNANPVPGIEGPGYFQGCLLPHDQEHVDIQFVRQILSELQGAGVRVDRHRVYGTGHSGGGGMVLTLAMEAPHLMAALSASSPIAYHPNFTLACHPHPDMGKTPLMVVANTADPVLPYEDGNAIQLPGQETLRDAWLDQMQIENTPTIDVLPDLVLTDSFSPMSGQENSWVERFRYPKGTKGSEFQFLKVHGGGHAWPNPYQFDEGTQFGLGKTNQDVDFGDVSWEFFARQPYPSLRSCLNRFESRHRLPKWLVDAKWSWLDR